MICSGGVPFDNTLIMRFPFWQLVVEKKDYILIDEVGKGVVIDLYGLCYRP